MLCERPSRRRTAKGDDEFSSRDMDCHSTLPWGHVRGMPVDDITLLFRGALSMTARGCNEKLPLSVPGFPMSLGRFELLEQRGRSNKIPSLQTFREPAVDIAEQPPRLLGFSLLMPQAGEARGCAQL